MFSHLEIFREAKKGVTIWGVTIMSRDSFCWLFKIFAKHFTSTIPHFDNPSFKNTSFSQKNLHFDKKSSLWQKSLIPTKPLIWASFLSKWIFFVEVKLFPVEVSHCKRKSFLFFQPFLLHNDFDAIVFEIENLNLVLSFDLLDYIIILDLYIKSFLVIRTQ